MDLTALQPSVIDPTIKGKNFLFYGPPGTRKTSVAARFPRPVFGQTEDGTKFISGVKGVRLKVWNDVLEFVRQLRRPEVKAMYDTVVFDRADTIYNYCYDYVLKQLNVTSPSEIAYGNGWKAIEREWIKAMNKVEAEGYGIIFITHDKDIMNQKLEYVGTKIKLESQAANVIRGMTDFIFNLRKEVVDGYQTVMAYSDLTSVETKKRARYFTEKFEFTYENLEKELRIAIEKQIKIEGITVQVQERKELKERPFEEVRANVLRMIQECSEKDSPHLGDITQLVKTQLQGNRISSVGESYYDQMLVIEAFLLSILD